MELRGFFAAHPRVALAFSGGTDSSFLLRSALELAEDLGVYCVRSAFQPDFERADALRLAAELGVPVTLIDLDVLACPQIAANPPDRCYHCKRAVFTAIRERAGRDGYPVLIDGTNADDDPADRPGFRALEELGVLSPLRLCGLGKAEIRRLSREAGLFTADKPAYACLATRIPCDEAITKEKLSAVETAEAALFDMGFRDFRVRSRQGRALVQVTAEQTELARARWADMEKTLAPLFVGAELDPKEREKSR